MTPDYVGAFDVIARNVREFIVLFIERRDKRRAREDANREERWNGLIQPPAISGALLSITES